MEIEIKIRGRRKKLRLNIIRFVISVIYITIYCHISTILGCKSFLR